MGSISSIQSSSDDDESSGEDAFETILTPTRSDEMNAPHTLSKEELLDLYSSVAMFPTGRALVVHQWKCGGAIPMSAALFASTNKPFGSGIVIKCSSCDSGCITHDLSLPEHLDFVCGIVRLYTAMPSTKPYRKRLKSKIVEECTSMLESASKSKVVWNTYRCQLKMGVCADAVNRKRLLETLRFSTVGQGIVELVSFAEYVARMKGNQDRIYFTSQEVLTDRSPLVRRLVNDGVEVVAVEDIMEKFAFKAVKEYQGYPLCSVNELDYRYRLFSVPTEVEQALYNRFAEALGGRVCLVQPTLGLDPDTPCVLVLRSASPHGHPEEEDWDEAMARRAQAGRLVLQLNMHNAIIRKLAELIPVPAHSEVIGKIARILYNTGLVACHLLPERDLRLDDLMSLTVPPENVEEDVIEY